MSQQRALARQQSLSVAPLCCSSLFPFFFTAGAGGRSDWVSEMLDGAVGDADFIQSAGGVGEVGGGLGEADVGDVKMLTEYVPRRGARIECIHIKAAAAVFGVKITVWEAAGKGLVTHSFSPPAGVRVRWLCLRALCVCVCVCVCVYVCVCERERERGREREREREREYV